MELLQTHLLLAITLSALVTVGIETVKVRGAKLGFKLSGWSWFAVSVLVSVVVAYGFTVYYMKLPTSEAVMVYVIMVLGAQGFYAVLFDKGKGDTNE